MVTQEMKRSEASESIHDLFDKVAAHPDFACGVIFTVEDVAFAVAGIVESANRGAPSSSMTEDQMDPAKELLFQQYKERFRHGLAPGRPESTREAFRRAGP